MGQAESKQSRQTWVDIAKGIAIIAVVLGHIRYSWPNTNLLPLSDLCIWLWHVPVFFMIGGFFLKEEKMTKPGSFILGKVKSLYLPLLYIYIPVLLLHNVFIRLGFYDVSIEYYGKYVTWWGATDYIKHIAEAAICAGREPLLGAMWFGFVLFMALCIISLTSWVVNKVGRKWSNDTQNAVKGLLFLGMAIISWALTQLVGFTIPRFNNTLIAVWLIFVGMLMVQKAKITFSNSFATVGCVLIAWQSAVCWGGVDLVANEFKDVIVLTVTSGVCLYVVCYLSKLFERVKWLNRILSLVGRDSLYIMGLHFIGFKFATLILNLFGANADLAILVPKAGGNVVLFVYYALFGVAFPLVFIYGLRTVKKRLKKQ